MVDSEGRDSWQDRQQWREERMRFEVLAAIYEACGGQPDCTLTVSEFAGQLGIWREELFRILDFLDRHRFIVYEGAGPRVSIARRGIDYIEKEGARRRSIRG